MSDPNNNSENYRGFLHFGKTQSTIVILNNIFYLGHRVVLFLFNNRNISEGIRQETTTNISLSTQKTTSITSIST